MKGKLDSKTSPCPVLAWERFARYPVIYGEAFKTLHNSAEWMEWPQMRETEMSPASASEPNQPGTWQVAQLPCFLIALW